MSNVAEAATELVADVADEVAEGATQVAAASRGLSGRELGLVLGSVAVGAGLGAACGFLFARRNLETKYNQIAEEEIAAMREHYQAKMLVAESKPSLEEIVTESGYAIPEDNHEGPPMAVTPPDAVVEAAAEMAEEAEEVSGEVVVTEKMPPVVRNVFEEAAKHVEDNWDYQKELSRRSPTEPYVIHIDEREEFEYEEVTLTYYEADDVLCNERDEIVEDREQTVGEKSLDRFGHGSGDPSVVYVRNDSLETVFEVIKSPNSYAEEVHGFKHSSGVTPRRGRIQFDDE